MGAVFCSKCWMPSPCCHSHAEDDSHCQDHDGQQSRCRASKLQCFVYLIPSSFIVLDFDNPSVAYREYLDMKFTTKLWHIR
jgi:hypothetical protein